MKKSIIALIAIAGIFTTDTVQAEGDRYVTSATSTGGTVTDVITIKAASGLSDTNSNPKTLSDTTANPKIYFKDNKCEVNNFDERDVGGDEWCKEVMSEIGKNVWSKNCEGVDSGYVSEPCIHGTGSGRLYIV